MLTLSQERLFDLLFRDTHEMDGSFDGQDQEEAQEEEGYDPVWKRRIDRNLVQMPTALLDPGVDRWVDCTYVIDLDSELFVVNHETVFDLHNIPRDGWLHALREPELFPEASTSINPSPYFIDGFPERDRYYHLYRESRITTYDIDTDTDTSLIFVKSPKHVLAAAVFADFADPGAQRLWESVATYNHDGFAFREIAFCVLSLAANAFLLDSPHRYVGRPWDDSSEGCLVRHDKTGHLVPMPLFGFGCHHPEHEPGSSPPGDVYALADVIVMLVPDRALSRDLASVIGRSIDHARITGNTGASIVIFSIVRAVLVQVDVRDYQVTVRHSHPFSVCNLDLRRPGGPPLATDACHPVDRLFSNHAGFAALQAFFWTSTLPPDLALTTGIFASEIYALIISHTDHATWFSCAQVSKALHCLCWNDIPFSDELNVTHFTRAPKRESTDRLHYGARREFGDLGIFQLRERNTGRVVQASLQPYHRSNLHAWCPVIGDGKRTSMVTQTCFELVATTESKVSRG